MTECKHEWEFQHDYSKHGSIGRYKCRKCGIWAWQTPSNKWDGFKAKPIVPYRGPVLEPESLWLRSELRPRMPYPDGRVPTAEDRGNHETRMEEAVYSADRFVDPGEL